MLVDNYSPAGSCDGLAPPTSDHELSLNWEHSNIIKKTSEMITKGNYPLPLGVAYTPRTRQIEDYVAERCPKCPKNRICTDTCKWSQEWTSQPNVKRRPLIWQIDWWQNNFSKWISAGKHQPTKMYGFLKFETFLPDCDDILMFFHLLVHIQDKMSKGVGKVDDYFFLLISKRKDPCVQQTQDITLKNNINGKIYQWFSTIICAF